MNRKAMILPMIFVTMFLIGIVTPVMGAYTISTPRDTVRANVQFKVTTGGLTESTLYTLYVDSTLYANRSASSTTLQWDVVLGDAYVGDLVLLELRESNGTTVHGSTYVTVEDIIPQNIITMIGGLIPYIAGFALIGVALAVIGGFAVKIKGMW